MKEKLARYGQLKSEMLEIESELRLIESELAEQLAAGESLEAHGFKAHWKNGRKQTDHEQAVIDAKVPAQLIEKHTTVKTTVAWAKITKEARLNLDEYTSYGIPQFKVEVVG